MEFSGGRLDVVDPEVRAYVASLVTAVSDLCGCIQPMLTRNSSEEVVQTKMAGIYSETTLLHVCEI